MATSTFARRMHILQLLPREPNASTVARLHTQLQDQGHAVTRRTVERDLQELSREYAIHVTEGRPELWSWTQEAPNASLPSMPPATALTYLMVEEHLGRLLPPTVLEQLKPAYGEARRVLERHGHTPIARWKARISSIPNVPRFELPKTDPEVLRVVYESLLREEAFEARYRAAQQRAAPEKPWLVHPQALVYRQGVIYLVATLWDYGDLRHLALHRMSDAGPCTAPFRRASQFDLKRYIEHERAFEYPEGETVNLVLRVSEATAFYLGETRLSRDQVIEDTRDPDWKRVRACVIDTTQLRWWLRSLGPEVEVVAPRALRRAMRKDARATAALYARRGG
ncbi:MAG TPA: WYL domain-containing protein [Xanthomonadaceae bacterium]|nr:WYL domain-containing protein [Xanthomonadaceae bacterium]